MRVMRLSSYFAGPREDWCDGAASIWPNAGERESLRTKCKSTPMGIFTFDPWTAVGKLQRGLPANFSTDPNMVSAGAAGAAVKIVGEATNVVAPVVVPQQAPPVTPVQPQTPPAQTPPAQAWLPSGWATVPPTVQSNMPIILGALVLGGLGLLVFSRRKRTGPVLAGYRKRSRRSRRR